MSVTTAHGTPWIILVACPTVTTSRDGLPSFTPRYTHRVPGCSGNHGLSTAAVKRGLAGGFGWSLGPHPASAAAAAVQAISLFMQATVRPPREPAMTLPKSFIPRSCEARETSSHARTGGGGRAADGERHTPLAREAGPGRRRSRARRAGRLDGGGDGLRRDRPRRDAARQLGLRGVPDAAPEGRLVAGPDAHRAGRGRRPGGGPRQRGRRLPCQAVRARRAARAAALARAARQPGAAGRGRGRRPQPRPRPARGARGRRADRPFGEGVLAARDADAPARRGALALRPDRARVGLRLRAAVERGRGLRAAPAREGRPAVRPALDRDRSRRRLSPA